MALNVKLAFQMLYKLMDNVKTMMLNEYATNDCNISENEINKVVNYIYESIEGILTKTMNPTTLQDITLNGITYTPVEDNTTTCDGCEFKDTYGQCMLTHLFDNDMVQNCLKEKNGIADIIYVKKEN